MKEEGDFKVIRMTQEEFYDFFHYALRRPGMFGFNKIEEVDFYFKGYIDALKNTISLEDFDQYVRANHGIPGHDFNWVRLTRLYSGSDAHSLELAKLWMDAFLSEKRS
jgi:hypothetical protein